MVDDEPGREGLSLLGRARRLLPRGGVLPAEAFAGRQRLVSWILLAHLPGITVFGLSRGAPLDFIVVIDVVVGLFVVAAWQPNLLAPRARAAVSAVGLLACSAILVHLSGGSIEMHFHFFVMVAVIALYQDWVPFLLAIAFVALHHGAVGVLVPEAVYDHHAAWASPLRWAVIHAAFVLAASAAQVASWRVVEDEHDRAAAKLVASERRFRALVEHSVDAVCVLDDGLSIAYESESTRSVLGFGPGDREGAGALEFVHPDDAAVVLAVFERVEERPGATEALEIRGRHRDGSWRWLDVRITNLRADPAIGGLVVNYRDVTARRLLEGELAHQAFHDSLSGLANRALFLDRLEHALATRARRDQGHVAVLFVDVDDFKTVNDALGHSAGDDLLKDLARRLRVLTRAADTCARLGGDEFAVLLEGLEHPDEVGDLGRRLLDALCEPVELAGERVTISASVGIAIGDSGSSAADLLRNADLAMYTAKRSGKGRCEVYRPAMHHAAVERLALRENLRASIEREELRNHYQPIVDLETGRAVGAEALVRWYQPGGTVVAPDAFMQLAEETGLILAIGQRVLANACKAAFEWPGELGVAVNVSGHELLETDLVRSVARSLEAADLAPHRLTVEITESVLIDDPHAAVDTLEALKALGVSIALDDFGTGFSSLSYLARFPVDGLKIDRSFVSALVRDPGGRESTLVDAIIDMSRTLGLEVTAEGIETPEQAAALRALGCARGQGYLFGRPAEQVDWTHLAPAPGSAATPALAPTL